MKTFKYIMMLFPIVFCFYSIGYSNDNEVYYYEPYEVELNATLIKKMFYGPPCYGENPDKDSKDYAYILRLPAPINVIAEENDELYETHKNVQEIQLVNIINIPLKSYLSKNITVRGTLFSSHTGHHYTEVLIKFSGIRLNKRK